MRKVNLLVLLVAFLAVPASLTAQGFGNAGIGIFGGVAMPMGEFADDDTDDEDAGFAKLGFTLGADAYLPLGTTPFGWVTSASVNSIGFDGEEAQGDDADFGRYLMIPIMTGVSYPFGMGTGMTLSPMAQIGLNLAMGPSGEVGDTEVSAGMGMALAFSLGANFMFSENLGATARWVNGGAPERDIDIEGQEDQEADNPISFVQLGVVWRLR